MANRPQVPGWTNINANKPEEYSSEFSIENKRFAVVTNVNTGQRQVYFVSGLAGTFLTNRTLLLTTNSDGTATKGAGYQDFVDRFGINALYEANLTSKTQSCFITKTASTSEEKDNLSTKKEYKSCYAGRNTDPNDNSSDGSSPNSGGGETSASQVLVYPLDIANTNQDRIKFRAVELDKRSGGSITGLPRYKTVSGEPSVYITIQGPISDQNGVTWGEDKMDSIQAGAFNVANDTGNPEESGSKRLEEEVDKVLKSVGNKIPQLSASAAVGNMNAFTRATQKVLNPNLELLFREPQLRPFSFTFLMSARDEEEAKVIKKIIRFFKKNMSPKSADGGVFLKAPNVFWIDYKEGKNKTHESINLIAPEELLTKACALENMRVDYTPMGTYMTFGDKEKTMVAYRMQLSFKEINPVYSDDYDYGVAKNHPIGY